MTKPLHNRDIKTRLELESIELFSNATALVGSVLDWNDSATRWPPIMAAISGITQSPCADADFRWMLSVSDHLAINLHIRSVLAQASCIPLGAESA